MGRPLASNVIANGGLLSIQSITLANRGLYVCIGTDGRRLDRKEVYIQVEDLKISLPEVIDAPMGEGVEITCSVSVSSLSRFSVLDLFVVILLLEYNIRNPVKACFQRRFPDAH